MRKYRRYYKAKRRKKRSILKNRFFWFFVFVFIIFGGGFYFLSFSQYFQVEGSEISGNRKVSSQNLDGIVKKEVEKNILFFPTRSIFFANLDEVKNKILNDFPQIAKINIKRSFPNKISIQIEEKEPVAVFCKDELAENCFLIDEEGIVIDFIKIIDSDGLRLAKIVARVNASDPGEKIIEKNYLAYILEIKKKLIENQEIEIKEFLPSGKKLTAIAAGGWAIFFDPLGDISDQIFNLDVLFKEKIPQEKRSRLEYIDLRFGSKTFIKYR